MELWLRVETRGSVHAVLGRSTHHPDERTRTVRSLKRAAVPERTEEVNDFINRKAEEIRKVLVGFDPDVCVMLLERLVEEYRMKHSNRNYEPVDDLEVRPK